MHNHFLYSEFYQKIVIVNRTDIQGAAKKHPLQKSHYFQINLIFLVKFSEVIRETSIY